MRKLYIGLLLVVILLFLPKVISAEAGCYQKQKINPDSIYYPIKRGYEKMRLALSKNYEKKLYENRVNELLYISDNKLIGVLESASSRFTSQVGAIIEDGKEDLISEEMIKSNKMCLEETRDRFEANSAQWMLVQYGIDKVNELSNISHE